MKSFATQTHGGGVSPVSASAKCASRTPDQAVLGSTEVYLRNPSLSDVAHMALGSTVECGLSDAEHGVSDLYGYCGARYQTPESPLAAKGGLGLDEMVESGSSPASCYLWAPATSMYAGGTLSSPAAKSFSTESDCSVIKVAKGEGEVSQPVSHPKLLDNSNDLEARWTVVNRGRKSVTTGLVRMVVIGIEPCTTPTFLASLCPQERKVLDSAKKVSVVAQPNKVWRLDVHCRMEERDTILACLKKVAYQRGYQRPKPFESFSKRKARAGLGEPANGGPTTPQTKNTSHGALITWNVRGIKGNRLNLEGLLQKLRPSVIALQETLWDRRQGPLCFAGYTVFERPIGELGRGNALMVSNNLSAYPIDLRSEHLVGAKVRVGDAMWTLISAYLPSGGNFRGKRTKAMKDIREAAKHALGKDRHARVVIMGDFNATRSDAERKITKWNLGLSIVDNKGADWTRCAKSGKLAALDYFIVSSGALESMSKAEVLRQWKGFSDHFPVRCHIRLGEAAKSQHSFRYSRAPEAKVVDKFTSSNRWEPLALLDAEGSSTALNAATSRFIEVCHQVADEVGLRTKVSSGTVIARLTRRELRAVKRYRHRFSELRRNPTCEMAKAEYTEAKAGLKLLNNSLDGKRKAAAARMVAELAKEGSERQLFRAVRKVCSISTPPVLQALRRNGQVEFGSSKVAEILGEHYSSLANASDGTSAIGNEDWSAMIGQQEVRTELTEVNLDLQWVEVKEALKRCNNHKATGPDGIPSEVLKLASSESESPDSSFAKALFALIKDQFHYGRVGDVSDNLATIHSLFKKGDVLDPGNYRGISLMSTVTKLTASIVAARITTALVSNGRLAATQAGFRPGEEGLAHVIALYEIARRRANDGQSTWALFVDFAKAFDSVIHEALFAKCEAIGIRGRSLRYIKALYAASYASAKVGETTSVPFKLGRGVRQGCPLSPILFNIFVNDLFSAARSNRLGVTTQGLHDPCPGLQFADDTTLLASSLHELRVSAQALEDWTSRWKLTVNVGKCGVMVFNGEDKVWAELESGGVHIGGCKVPVVDSYTYLGVGIHRSFGYAGQDRKDLAHAIALRCVAGRKKLMSLRPLLTNHRIPIAIKVKLINTCLTPVLTYGGEWFGLHGPVEKLDGILVTAAKWVLRSRASSNLMNGEALLAGLGIEKASFRCSCLRVRAYLKYPTLDTIVGTLLTDPYRGKSKTWQTYTVWYLKTYVKLEIDREDRSLSTNHLEMLGAWHRKGQKKVNSPPVKMTQGQVRNLQALLLWLPSGYRGEVLLYRYCLGGLWDFRKRCNAKQGASLDRLKGRCCACGSLLKGIDEWGHVILGCPAYVEARKAYLPGWCAGLKLTATSVHKYIADKVTNGLSGPTLKSSDLRENTDSGKGIVQNARALALFLSRVAPDYLDRVFSEEDREPRLNVFSSTAFSDL